MECICDSKHQIFQFFKNCWKFIFRCVIFVCVCSCLCIYTHGVCRYISVCGSTYGGWRITLGPLLSLYALILSQGHSVNPSARINSQGAPGNCLSLPTPLDMSSHAQLVHEFWRSEFRYSCFQCRNLMLSVTTHPTPRLLCMIFFERKREGVVSCWPQIHYVAQAGFEVSIILTPSFKCCELNQMQQA